MVETAAPVVAGGRAGFAGTVETRARPLAEVGAEQTDRIATGIAELDRVLGGGIVAGSVLHIVIDEPGHVEPGAPRVEKWPDRVGVALGLVALTVYL